MAKGIINTVMATPRLTVVEWGETLDLSATRVISISIPGREIESGMKIKVAVVGLRIDTFILIARWTQDGTGETTTTAGTETWAIEGSSMREGRIRISSLNTTGEVCSQSREPAKIGTGKSNMLQMTLRQSQT
jgi:hypothetical protein